MERFLPNNLIIPGPGLWSVVLCLSALMILSYIYFLASSVVYVAATKGLVRDIAATHISIGTLESEYLSTVRNLEESQVAEYGLSKIVVTHFVPAPESALSLVRSIRQ